MIAGRYDISIQQGSDWEIALVWKDDAGNPVNVTGWKARMQVRTDLFATRTQMQVTNPSLGGTFGEIRLSATATQTAAILVDRQKLTWVNGKPAQLMVYDIELFTDDGRVQRILQGVVNVYPEVTR